MVGLLLEFTFMQTHGAMTTKLPNDEATRDIFLAVVYELLKTNRAAGLLKAARK